MIVIFIRRSALVVSTTVENTSGTNSDFTLKSWCFLFICAYWYAFLYSFHFLWSLWCLIFLKLTAIAGVQIERLKHESRKQFKWISETAKLYLQFAYEIRFADRFFFLKKNVRKWNVVLLNGFSMQFRHLEWPILHSNLRKKNWGVYNFLVVYKTVESKKKLKKYFNA